MTKEKEYVVSFNVTQQISPDDWEVITPSLKVTDNTTIGEIVSFYEKKCGKATVRFNLNELE